MKLNWTIALMCVATLTFVACKDKNQPYEGGDDPDVEYTPLISVNDNSVADWDKLDPSNVAVSKATPNPLWDGVHMLKVYADEVYINWMIVFDPVKYVKHRDVDVMHVFIDIDHSTSTGGYFDLFKDACADLMFEGSLYSEGAPINYAPSVYQWGGKVNGEGWESWGEAIGTIQAESQFVTDSILEVRVMKEKIPGKDKFSTEGFGFGITMTQNFEVSAVGFLPQGDTPNGENIGRLNMLSVKFTKTMK